MKFLVVLLLLSSVTAFPQAPSNSYKSSREQEKWPETVSDTGWYTVGGARHGISYFKQHRFEEVEYEPKEKLEFNRYHSPLVMYAWLERWSREYPGLVDLYEPARSYEGRPIYQVTITNKNTGKDTDKPAAYFEGGRHSGEVTSSESALWFIKHLLENYGKDPEITGLLDEAAIYVRVQNNPDGASLYLYSAQRNRSTVRPSDNDHDGLLDEDPEEDLDGDGVIHQIRWKVDQGGTHIQDPRDPTGRLMKRVPKGEGSHRIISEGIDNDGDGEYNEDGIGGLDLHRNYPENWRPDAGLDATGRGYTQNGAGEYPLSEIETRSVFTWLITHPNISVINSMDTRVPMHLRGPSVAFEHEIMEPSDARYYQRLDTLGMQITGYPWAGDVFNTYHTRYPVNPWSGDSTRPSPLFGHGPDFGYSYLGTIWYGDELWNGGMMGDLNGDGESDELDALLWDDNHNGGKGFREWSVFLHPELGEVEIGGFHPKFFSQNGPPEVLEKWAGNQALYNIELAKSLPKLKLIKTEVNKFDANRDSASYEILVHFKNTGKLPTALYQAQLVKIVRPDQVSLVFNRNLSTTPDPRLLILVPEGKEHSIETGFANPGEEKQVRFIVRKYGRDKEEIKIRISSTRGGIQEFYLSLD